MLVPKMRKIKVSPDLLILDPNNPRLISRKEDRTAEHDVLNPGIMDRTRLKMEGGDKDDYRIKELENSIKKNGWQPVDSIFVRKYDDNGRYIVLEGNRRVTAIRRLFDDPEIDGPLKDDLQNLEVMEIIDEGLSREELEKKISYLLGVRHHGSLKSWSPFAQAHNMHIQYIAVAGQTDDHFAWNDQSGSRIADALSIKPDTVKERLKVFKAMQQIGNSPEVKQGEPAGGMKDRYYSVCQEVLIGRMGKIKEYIKQDPDTFLLDELSVQRMNNLCHFDNAGRTDAPINNPQQWRYLDNILSDEDAEKRTRMLAEVEVEKRRPDAVWAQRAEELRRLQWDKWLFQVGLVLGGVTVANIQLTDLEKEIVTSLVSLLDSLDNVAEMSGGIDA